MSDKTLQLLRTAQGIRELAAQLVAQHHATIGDTLRAFRLAEYRGTTAGDDRLDQMAIAIVEPIFYAADQMIRAAAAWDSEFIALVAAAKQAGVPTVREAPTAIRTVLRPAVTEQVQS